MAPPVPASAAAPETAPAGMPPTAAAVPSVPVEAGGAGTTDPAPEDAGRSPDPDFWDRYLALWHTEFVVVVAVIAIGSAAGHDSVRWYGVGAEVVMIVSYLLVGRSTLNNASLRRAIPQAGLLVVLFGIAVVTQPLGGFLLFALVPYVCRALSHRLWLTLAGTCALMVTLAIKTLAQDGFSAYTATVLTGTVLVPTILSVLFSIWLRRILAQSAQRGALIAELDRTRAQLAAERHEAGIRTERERLAAEIHDTLAQGFTSILMLGQAARAGLDQAAVGGPDPRTMAVLTEQLDLIAATARENLAEARSLVAALGPADLADGTLPDALRRLIDRMQRDTGVHTQLTVTGTPAWRSPDYDVVLLRITQEALYNVRKHAAARSVHVQLSYLEFTVLLTIQDDGVGLPDPGESRGFGLIGIRNRAEALGGSLDVDSTPGAGTRLRVALPRPDDRERP